MTAAVRSQVEDPLPDWVVAGELMAGRTPPTPPTEADVRLAVWLLLDAGQTRYTIERHTTLVRSQIRAVEKLRAAAADDDAGIRASVADLAPTAYERMILRGVSFGAAP